MPSHYTGGVYILDGSGAPLTAPFRSPATGPRPRSGGEVVETVSQLVDCDDGFGIAHNLADVPVPEVLLSGSPYQ